MKKIIVWIILIAFVLSAFAAAVFSQVADGSILNAPAAPAFSDAERQAELGRRRTEVAKRLPDDAVLVLLSAEARNYAGDVDFMYRQENNLYYLTGLKQKNAALLIVRSGGKTEETLFIPKRDPRKETWEGSMYSNDDATRISGIKRIADADQFDALLSALKDKKDLLIGNETLRTSSGPLFLQLPLGDRDPMAPELTREKQFRDTVPSRQVTNVRPIFDELRLIKSSYELKLLQHAIDITTEAQLRSMAMVGRAKWEYQVQAEVEYTFRRRNADYWGYASIVGCGPNATTLHYTESQSPVVSGQLLLMDVGAEYDHYTADVTRTFPVNGKFSKEQADIYRIVFDAQEAAAKAAKPGATFADVSEAANRAVADGLYKLGLITDKESGQSRLWFMHGLGHWLGMNVHDVGDYNTPLAPGMVFTNEPGIYIRADTFDGLPNTPQMAAFKEKIRPAFERYKNIGVRIEDDMLVTRSGVEWMTKALPRKLEDIEAFMAAAPAKFQYTAGRGFKDPFIAALTKSDRMY